MTTRVRSLEALNRENDAMLSLLQKPPILHLPLENSLDVLRGSGSVDFTRASGGSYIDRYGILQSVAVDGPRFEAAGLLVEGESTNLTANSEDLTLWNATNVTVTGNAATAPDGTVTAEQLDCTVAGGATRVNSNAAVVDTGQDITVSAFVKAGTMDKVSIRFIPSGGTTAQDLYADFDMTSKTFTSDGGASNVPDRYGYTECADGWFRIWISSPLNNSGHTVVTIRIGAPLDTSDTGTVFAWGAQTEELSFASSYIVTAGATVTRAADVCKVLIAGNAPSYVTEDVTTAITTDTTGHNLTTQQFIYILKGTSVESFYWWEGAIDTLISYLASVRSAEPAAADMDQLTARRMVSVVEGTTRALYVDGTNLVEDTGLSRPTADYPDEYLYLGSNNTSIKQLFGHVKDFRIYDRALTAAEIALL